MPMIPIILPPASSEEEREARLTTGIALMLIVLVIIIAFPIWILICESDTTSTEVNNTENSFNSSQITPEKGKININSSGVESNQEIQSEIRYCTHCGEKYLVGQNFCNKCGSKLTEGSN